ncbi:hypothetical protein DB346_22705 [Verrucomicrobia bacterium LW23]|nr:hypothetical protein DB346_22705 [Verrucomicrobia bacterium LW23]
MERFRSVYQDDNVKYMTLAIELFGISPNYEGLFYVVILFYCNTIVYCYEHLAFYHHLLQ